jgi:hypothetical protein
MPFHFVALYETLLGLRKLVFPSPVAAAIFDDLEYPGLFSGYAARAAYQCWFAGELPLWAVAQGGGQPACRWVITRQVLSELVVQSRDLPIEAAPLVEHGCLAATLCYWL